MANLKLTQLSTSEFKLDSVSDFCLNSHGNCLVLNGNSNDITILELMNSCDSIILMPYTNKQILICQDKPLKDILRNIDLVTIYENSTVQESQELSLDIIYTAECAVEPLKARVLQADILIINDINICCMLTTYGHCELYQKVPITEEWKSLDTNLSHILITDVFSSKGVQSNIKTYNDLKTFANKYIITCFAMSEQSSDMVIYLGTAAGYVVILKYVDTLNKFEELCHLKTSLYRICYIAIYNNLIFIACDQGKICLMKVDLENNYVQELEYLWSKSDKMTCRKAVFTYNEDLNSYLVIFCKTAHILAYRLDKEGEVLSSSTLYVSGIKITGIESISDKEFLITTITGSVKYIKIFCPTKESLNIEEQMVAHEFDSANYQILGLANSSSKNLWSLVLFRNKDYLFQSKYTPITGFLNVCKLGIQDSFIKLINMNLKNMNKAQDLIIAINLEIFNNQELDKYLNYLDLEKLTFPEQLNDAFLQKLQIKIIITRKLATFQNMKYRKLKLQTKNELEILEPALQLLHILSRLCYLKQLNTKKLEFTKFQKLSIICMQMHFSHLLNDFIAINNTEEENNQQKIIDKFSHFVADEYEKYKFDNDNIGKHTEYCMVCDQPIKNFAKCDQGHEIKRCSISCTQLALFKTKYCPHCFALARNDDTAKLEELYSKDEYVKCIYCRFLLKQDQF